ncbi:MAG TPA: hypothetical protein VIC85_03795 [Ktedonobacterales bacterium]
MTGVYWRRLAVRLNETAQPASEADMDRQYVKPGPWAALKRLNTEDRFVIGSMLLTLAGIALGALVANANIFGFTILAVLAVLVSGLVVTHSPRLAWLFPFGAVAGVLELWADWVHVTALHSLVYTNFFGFKVLASPSYMPIGWGVTAVQFGYLALRLRERWPAWAAVGALAVLGLAIPPWYEELAAPAHAWHYTTRGPALSHTPVWVILTYAGCMFFIATAALTWYARGAWGRAVVAGAFAGAGLMFSSVAAISLLGR